MAGKRVTILDCGHGNITSVVNAFRALGAETGVTSDPDNVRRASILVFPGQGAAPPAMRTLRESGLGGAFTDVVKQGIATLGICLGMQLVLNESQEGPTECLGLLSGDSARFPEARRGLKVPQIGWNTVEHDGDPIFEGIPTESFFYFVHSYYCRPDPAAIIGTTEFGISYASVLRRDNLWATQFHPEKSGETGLGLLRNFLNLAQC